MRTMKNYLTELWNDQLNNHNPLSIPFYSGNGMMHHDFKLENIFSGMHLFKTRIESDIIAEINKWAEKFTFDDYRMVINSTKFVEVNNSLDSFVKVILSYDILNKDDVKVDSHRINIINYPKVQDNHTFLVNGSYFSVIDELINDFSLNYREYDNYKEVNVRCTEGRSILVRKYFDGTGIVIFKHYNKLVKSLMLKDLTDSEFEEFNVASKLKVVKYFINDIEINPESTSKSLTELIFNHIDNSNYFVEDDIRSKRVYSAYDLLKEILFDNLKYIFSQSIRLKTTKLRRVYYSTFTSKLHGSPTFSYINDLNPISYLSSMRKMDLMGPHGPKISSLSMRDFRQSYLGVIDPLETPESGKLGLVIHRAIGSVYDENGKIKKVEGMDEAFASFNFSASTLPFINYSDSIRDSMACSHIKQAVPLEDNEVPYVSTGADRVVERLLNRRVISPVNGVVASATSGCIKIIDENDQMHSIDCPSSELSNDKTMIHHSPRVKKGDTVTAGYELTTNNSYRDGYLTLGRNVLIAWMPYKGLNYEDSVIISQSLSEKLISQKGYKISYTHSDKLVESESLPTVGDRIEKGQVIMKYKKKVKGVALMDLYSDAYEYIKAEKSGVVTEVLTTDLDGNIVAEDWKRAVIKVSVPHKVEVGDKMSFSSAAKCTLSKILPDDQMPVNDRGEVIDIIHNTIGIPSRMNLSQLFEASMGYINRLIRSDILPSINDKESLLNLLNKINSVFNHDNFIHFIDYVKSSNDDVFNAILNNIKDRFVIEVKQFDKSITMDKINELVDVLGLKDQYNPEDGNRVFLPEFGKYTKFPVFYGSARILVLKHLVSEKRSATSIGGLSDCREKSQKVGEMEILGLEAHGAANMINELTLMRSNKSAKSRILRDILTTRNDDGILNLKSYTKSNASYDEFRTIFRSMGIVIKESNND